MCNCHLCNKELTTNQEIGNARLRNPKRLLCAQLFLSAFGYKYEALKLNKYCYLCKKCAVIKRPNGYDTTIFKSEVLIEMFENTLVQETNDEKQLGF